MPVTSSKHDDDTAHQGSGSEVISMQSSVTSLQHAKMNGHAAHFIMLRKVSLSLSLSLSLCVSHIHYM